MTVSCKHKRKRHEDDRTNSVNMPLVTACIMPYVRAKLQGLDQRGREPPLSALKAAAEMVEQCWHALLSHVHKHVPGWALSSGAAGASAAISHTSHALGQHKQASVIRHQSGNKSTQQPTLQCDRQKPKSNACCDAEPPSLARSKERHHCGTNLLPDFACCHTVLLAAELQDQNHPRAL
jgi:hypothetical protein